MNKRKAAMKINLNSDGQELHPFQQNKQLPLITIHWTKKKQLHMMKEKAHNCGGVKPVNWIPTRDLFLWI